MRNPWGSEKYEGPWSDNDSKWTADYKSQAGLVAADDGKFFMALKDFKYAFTSFHILMYQDWKKSQIVVKGTGKQFDSFATSPAAQAVVISFDYENERQTPAGCAAPNVFYNYYISAASDPWNFLARGAVSRQTAYAAVKLNMKAGVKYKVMLVNWADTSATTNVTVTTWAEGAAVPMSE